MPVPSLKVEAETPESDQGDTADRPIPAPKATSSRVSAAVATAPAATAPQDTPELCRSITDVGLVLIEVSIGYLRPKLQMRVIFGKSRRATVTKSNSHRIYT